LIGKKALFYKVGHLGSHNAPLREKGLEEMKSLKLAFVAVNQEMAKKKNWNKMPLGDLMDRLKGDYSRSSGAHRRRTTCQPARKFHRQPCTTKSSSRCVEWGIKPSLWEGWGGT